MSRSRRRPAVQERVPGVPQAGARREVQQAGAPLQAMVRRAPRDRFNVFLGFCAPGSEGVRQRRSAGAEFTESLDERGGRRRTACAEAEATGPTRKRNREEAGAGRSGRR